ITTTSNNITLYKMYTSLDDIINKTGFTFSEDNRDNVSFIPTDKYTLSDIASNTNVNTTDNTLSLPQEDKVVLLYIKEDLIDLLNL
ncbi:MAG: hypothetical protein IJ481_00545, partial [Alphaproteobacteria bacterium]|nr:hypothetical protein [Alphaproteobacteria bacterium]